MGIRHSIHEAAHTAVAIRLGLPVERVTVEESQPQVHFIINPRSRSDAERALRVMLAAPTVELAIWGYSHGGGSDVRDAAALASLWSLDLAAACEETRTLVRELERTICFLAELLEAATTLSGADLERLPALLAAEAAAL